MIGGTVVTVFSTNAVIINLPLPLRALFWGRTLCKCTFFFLVTILLCTQPFREGNFGDTISRATLRREWDLPIAKLWWPLLHFCTFLHFVRPSLTQWAILIDLVHEHELLHPPFLEGTRPVNLSTPIHHQHASNPSDSITILFITSCSTSPPTQHYISFTILSLLNWNTTRLLQVQAFKSPNRFNIFSWWWLLSPFILYVPFPRNWVIDSQFKTSVLRLERNAGTVHSERISSFISFISFSLSPFLFFSPTSRI